MKEKERRRLDTCAKHTACSSEAYPTENGTQAQALDLSGFDQAAALLKELRARGVVCAIWAMAGSTRNIKDAPFCWQHKEALQVIRDYLEDGHGHCALALSVYVALSQLASDAQSETFTAPISEIARRAAVSYRTAADVLKRFEALELIAVQRSTVPGTKEHAPSTYTMLGTPCLTLGKHFRSSLPRTDTDKKKNKSNNDQARARGTNNAEGSSTSNAGSKPSVPSPSFLGKGYQDQGTQVYIPRQLQEQSESSAARVAANLRKAWGNKPIQQHIKWPEFVLYCKGMSGRPREKGFWTWLSKQKPCWRDRMRRDADEPGYVLNGKFYGAAEANTMAAANSELRFRPAVRRSGKIILTDNGAKP